MVLVVLFCFILYCFVFCFLFSLRRELDIHGVVGQVELNFLAKFFFSTGPLYRPSPLIVETLLTTEKAQGELRGGTGTRLDADGNCRMVGVARLASIDDLFMDTFLMMPTDCLADMAANITFTS